ncbi:hypothetical protein RYZ27_14345 [Hyphomonas sp. FCG-A18]|uniref:hypothetical protein n=1 Tax=Hyphomonas sp. FCG-A18 TaxID=3080019 RepID=UPI002B2FA63E|nr:hypothetical protein RYZ27_14345 [Hyphomonas sp. FCG-A18]
MSGESGGLCLLASGPYPVLRNSRVVMARGGERSQPHKALKPGPVAAKAAWETTENAPLRARSGWALSLVVRQAVNRVHPERASVLYIAKGKPCGGIACVLSFVLP